MQKVNLFTHTDGPTPVIITMEHPIPTASTLEAQRQLFEQEAALLGMLLLRTLPGGTIDQLLVYLLQHQASLYVVGHKSKEDV